MRYCLCTFGLLGLLLSSCATSASVSEPKTVPGAQTCHISGGISAVAGESAAEKDSSSDSAQDESDQKNSQEVADSFAIREGDALQILVYNHPDLSMKLKVPPGGTITYPLIGKITVLGKQPGEIESVIKEALEKEFFKSVSVTVLVEEYAARKIYVLGAVGKPGSYEIEVGQKLTFVQAISLAGGFLEGAAKENIKLLRFKDQIRHTITLSFGEIEEKGNVGKDLVLKPDDTIIVPALRKIYILGSVNKPGAYSVPAEEWLTISKAVALAGGLSRIAAPSKIILIRTSQKGERTAVRIDVSAVLQGSTEVPDPDVEPGDIIFVPESVF
jgi:polysaccharide export outer membrane protein